MNNPNNAGKSEGKTLVLFFSHSGNTKIIARQIFALTGGDLIEIEPDKVYPNDYQAVVDQAKTEINQNFRPSLKNKIVNLDEYKLIFIGSPNWWNTIAPPISTFLTTHKLSGKAIAPFMTHEGTGMGHALADIQKFCPQSKILDGIPIRGGAVQSAQKQVEKWVREISG